MDGMGIAGNTISAILFALFKFSLDIKCVAVYNKCVAK